MTEPENDKPESVIDDLQESLEKSIENTAEPRTTDDEGGPIDDKDAPAT